MMKHEINIQSNSKLRGGIMLSRKSVVNECAVRSLSFIQKCQQMSECLRLVENGREEYRWYLPFSCYPANPQKIWIKQT